MTATGRQLGSTGALVFEQLARAAVNLVIGIAVARHLGPVDFGLFNSLIAQVSLVAAAAALGINGILLRELVANPERQSLDLGVAFWLSTGGAALGILALAGLAMLGAGAALPLLLAASMVAVVPFTVIDLYALAVLRAEVPALCRLAVLAIGAGLKLLAIRADEPLLIFFTITALEQGLLVLGYGIAAKALRMPPFLRRFSKARAREMLGASWPILLMAIAAAVQIRIGQILVSTLGSAEEAGIFAAASRIYEAWIYIPHICLASFTPGLIRAKNQSAAAFERRFEALIRGLFYITSALTLIAALFGAALIGLSFGPEYAEAAPVLLILMAAAMAAVLGSAVAQYFIIGYRERLAALRQFVAAALTLLLGLALVPPLGAGGAALAVLLAMFGANYLLLWALPSERNLLRLLHRALRPWPERAPKTLPK